ncbi:ribosome hibernation-promoting factor, HPF/YfiA family [Paenirhodobacter populi]|uniref:Ribosome hibernation promoting factor n=1 Tax=Paenirhodobacter populi TaxID=2306993 RepID=A0A443IVK3_9RHOB|nr:ribosome-associated translation inhibitor RaiA [Sinirhodobacter populi]RWR10190.1 ribosome-associated translation inhibitor RaiA [Sinirhodobacter populi]RWR12076.1 ribosome-associated translation inhibitor RaiA [Sinirhodobacter populi]RWR21713.1 ribosome-associated translation inhibitor RaiA [Sinirhodobacter populi]RWR30177.1 ribosome-associated translation inhibitor RaiA [Sinirhodobacter populi]RWR31597.1 ribosome-associated translation inhibitor RaiA [Sinirhodobacter populi]
MRYQISGKQLDIGEALQSHVKTGLDATVDKYMQRPTDATIVFSKNAHEYSCEASLHLSTGLTATASGKATEIYAAFEACREKMDKQLRRHKRRLKDHSRERSQPVEFAAADMYVLAADEDETEADGDSLAPVIVAEMEMQVPTCSVGEAVLQMELAGKPLLVFRNEKHGGVNVVYSRDDGHVGWIDPRNSK